MKRNVGQQQQKIFMFFFFQPTKISYQGNVQQKKNDNNYNISAF